MPLAWRARSACTRLLLREELADRGPDVGLAAEMAGADRPPGGLQLGEDLGELRLARAEGGDAAGLDVARVVHLRGDVAQRDARLVAVFGGVLAVRGVEEVGVVAARVVARRHGLQREARDAGAHRAAARGGLEELALLEFPGLRGVREEHRLHLGVLAADALQGEEEELLREPPLRVVHAAGDVEREDHRRVDRRARALDELAEAQVVVDDGDGIVLDVPALDGFLERPPPVEARSRAALVPALAHEIGLVHRRRAARLELGELQLFPQPVDDLVDLQLDHETDLAVAGPALARIGAGFASRLQDFAGLAAPLARALLDDRVGEAQPRVLHELDRHHYRAAGRAGHQVRAGEQLGQPALYGFANLLVMPQPVAGTPGEEVVPRRFRGNADHVIPGRAGWSRS